MSQRLASLIRRPHRPLRFPSPAAAVTTTSSRSASSFLQDQPAPPRLPAEQQAEFERLQRAAEAQLSSHNTITAASPAQQQQQQPLATSRHVSTPSSSSSSSSSQPPHPQPQIPTLRTDDGGVSPGTLSGGIRKGAPPEFEGEMNPKTGEVGGPKNEPLRWGSAGDWSYNGRVTDF